MSAASPRQKHELSATVAELDRYLAGAAVSLGAGPDLGDMARVLLDATTPVRAAGLVGLGLCDATHNVVVVTVSVRKSSRNRPHPGLLASEGEEFALGKDGANDVLSGPEVYVSPPLSAQSRLPLDRRFCEIGLSRYVSIPLLSQGNLLGLFFCGFSEPDVITDDVLAYLQRLAQILTPAFVNYRTRTRLAKGDRRRATLVELSHAINTSLRLETVLDSAREAIGRIEGHRAGCIPSWGAP